MMRAASLLPCLSALALLLPAAPAPAQVTLGRLFATPAERATMDAARGSRNALLPNSQGQPPAPGMPGGAPAPGAAPVFEELLPGQVSPVPGGAPAAPPPPPPAVTMTGILRSSNSNRSVVWLNGVPQPGLQAAASGVTVTMPSGKKIKLKPGQRYDLNTGRIKDVNEP
ncbi:hypothetical protein SAMN05216319_0727 [Duganella sp. CF402]|uniref:hypothetical protein n=1 Tax=unclassified Duganella TaxID=2636909 RepID=UPI0008CE751F|nr:MULTISPECIES: hypothetical protein [unclassified Duganella]RZT10808.1 hypothetical protein EV582_2899 [Duganella sp. BK701]SEK95598.1 hypothetical protein SAMN05216319_0727 [Duganella sp. CF402]